MRKIIFAVMLTGSMVFFSSCEVNKKPTGSIYLEQKSVFPEFSVKAISQVTDDDPELLELTWSVSAGELKEYANKDTVKWTVPSTAGNYNISLDAYDGTYTVTINEELEVKACDYYDQYNTVRGNIGQNNLDADIFDGKAILGYVDDINLNPYGFLGTDLEGKNVEFNNALVNFGYDPYDNGHVCFVFYFEIDDAKTGYQLEAVQLDINPLDATENWALKCKIKDFSTGDYYWDYLDNSSYGSNNNISTVYKNKFQDIKLERTADNSLNFYFENELVYTSSGIKDLIAGSKSFNSTLNRVLFYIFDETYMEVDYMYLYQ